MKDGQEALTQYVELATALAEVGASWIVDEVDEVIARGKSVPFRDLSDDEHFLYERRLHEEVRKGVSVGRAKASDSIGVPYRPEERLALLVDATELVITTSERSHDYVSRFAIRLGMNAVILEQPVGTDLAARAPQRREVAVTMPVQVAERLAVLHRVLYDEVLD